MAGEKVHTPLIFPLFDLKAQCWLGQIERFSRSTKVTRSANFQESF
ncbi:hypothetical protein ECP03048166_4093 [Escherichia coli P0304816.6]|nr:hypothetical protein ECP03048166_4093 [Escherichia coli P0304816.6]